EPFVEVLDRALVGVAELLEPSRPLLFRRGDLLEDVLADETVADRLVGEFGRVLADLLLQRVIERRDLAVRLLRLPPRLGIAADHGLHASGRSEERRVGKECGCRWGRRA